MKRLKEKDKISFINSRLGHGVCSGCGCATGVIQVKEQKLFQRVVTRRYCAYCKPTLHNAQ